MKYTPDYTIFQTLKNYALRYYFKYNISIKKLESKLIEKSKDSKLSKEVLLNIASLLQENNILDNLVRNLAEKGKSEKFILNKLKLKGFIESEIKEIISTNVNIISISSKIQLQNTIKDLLLKKPFKSIIFSLKQKGYDQNLIQELIDELGEHNQEELILNTIESFKSKGIENNKIIQKILQKGFSYNEFKNFLN
ncbi:MAG: hypothetical protein PHZ26_01065 [Candidatus Gracilibacteria bacterium]|nr:hypothetical protein [Candidatus Gracilibacteria bacterium]MDD2908325.1 hypothetical protein [Candidatus Gracilibacteria bacterium]